jgi:tRNA uridine 5-carboxymethylaminomethyl modification enzyme
LLSQALSHERPAGTPPRLDGRSIAYAQLAPQLGDTPPVPFSFLHEHAGELPFVAQVPCYLTQTTAATHAVLVESAHLSPEYEGVEPRCGVRGKRRG